MGLSLYLLGIILTLFILFAVLIGRSDENKTYENLDIEEWDCPECGFHVQVGDVCIYCNKKKDQIIN